MKYVITGEAKVTVEGTNYTALVPATAYDDDNTVIATTELQVAGALTDTANQFKTKLASAASTWKTAVASQETIKGKISKLNGTEL